MGDAASKEADAQVGPDVSYRSGWGWDLGSASRTNGSKISNGLHFVPGPTLLTVLTRRAESAILK